MLTCLPGSISVGMPVTYIDRQICICLLAMQPSRFADMSPYGLGIALQSTCVVHTALQGWFMQLHLAKAQHNVTEFLGDHNDFRPQRFLDANNQLFKYASHCSCSLCPRHHIKQALLAIRLGLTMSVTCASLHP